MLSIQHSKNTDAAVQYFKESLAVEDYYSEKKEVTGKFYGKAAHELGLTGDVNSKGFRDFLSSFNISDTDKNKIIHAHQAEISSQDFEALYDSLNLSEKEQHRINARRNGEVNSKDFENLLYNIDPNTGQRLTARNSPNRRPMYDATFSAPKSLSLIYGITGDEDLIKAHSNAVAKVMTEIEENMQTQVGTGKGKHYETTGNAIYSTFLHTTTRPLKKEVDGKKVYIPEPQIHSHNPIINATLYKGKFKAIEMGIIKREAPYYEALYHSYLAQETQKAGYEIEREGKRWEIAGITKEMRDKVSSRTIEIEALAEEKGIKSAESKAQLGRLTRNSKNKSVADNELPSIWKNRYMPQDLATIENAKQQHSIDDKDKGNQDPSMSPTRFVDLAMNHFFERNAVIQEKKVLAHAIDHSSAICTPDQIKKELASRQNILSSISKNDVKYITTKELVNEEERLISRAANGKANYPSLNSDYKYLNHVLNKGQKAAIKHVLTSKDQISIISGDAGVGKTTLLQEVQNGIRQNGKELFAFAPSSDAARTVLRNKGFESAETIAMLLKSEKIQEQLKDQVMVIDEGGLVGVPTMNKILDIADRQNTRVIISGDYKQHSAVERGDAQYLLETQAKLKVARVDEVVRQRKVQEYKDIITNIAKTIGYKDNPAKHKEEMTKVFERLDKNGNIVEVSDREKRHDLLAEDYLKSTIQNSDDAIVVSPTHAEGKDIAKAIRHTLKDAGRIGKKDKEFTRLENKRYTDSQKQMSEYYAKGDVVEFHQNAKGFEAGLKYLISKKDKDETVFVRQKGFEQDKQLPLDQYARFTVFHEEKINLAINDRLKMTKNSKSVEGVNLYNGQVYDIKGFDLNGNIKLSNGQLLDKNTQHFNQGYVTTSHSSQGKDAKTVLVGQSTESLGAASDKQFYVSTSRGTEELRIYTDDKVELLDAITKNNDTMAAREIAVESGYKSSEKLQQRHYMDRVKDFYETRVIPNYQHHIEPINDTLKSTNHEQSISKGELGQNQPDTGHESEHGGEPQQGQEP